MATAKVAFTKAMGWTVHSVRSMGIGGYRAKLLQGRNSIRYDCFSPGTKIMTTTNAYIFQGMGKLALSVDSANPLKFRKQLIYADLFTKRMWNGKLLEVPVDSARMDHWANSGNEMVAMGIRINLPEEHTDTSGTNRGKIIGYERGLDGKKRDSLFGIIEFSRQQYADHYASSSDISIYAEKSVHLAGKDWNDVITHVALTSRPVVNDLDGFAIALSRGVPPMKTRKKAPKGDSAEVTALSLRVKELEAREAAAQAESRALVLSQLPITKAQRDYLARLERDSENAIALSQDTSVDEVFQIIREFASLGTAVVSLSTESKTGPQAGFKNKDGESYLAVAQRMKEERK